VALVRVDIGGVSVFAEVTAEAARELELSEGAAVWVIVKATSLRVTRAAL
jgi:molybdopterin-binding protein